MIWPFRDVRSSCAGARRRGWPAPDLEDVTPRTCRPRYSCAPDASNTRCRTERSAGSGSLRAALRSVGWSTWSTSSGTVDFEAHLTPEGGIEIEIRVDVLGRRCAAAREPGRRLLRRRADAAPRVWKSRLRRRAVLVRAGCLLLAQRVSALALRFERTNERDEAWTWVRQGDGL